jgi:hypothetical protein
MMRRTVLFLALVALVLAPTSASATAPQGPVTIETEIDFSTDPFSGTFVVTEGEGLLGCSHGTFVDYGAGINPPSGGGLAKYFTCAGPGSGGFVANFQTWTGKSGPGEGNGNWNVTSGTGDFAKLHGRGDFWVVTAGDSGEETLTGSIHFD